MLEPYMIDRLEKELRQREEQRGTPLHITPPEPIPEEDPPENPEGWPIVIDFEV